MMLFSPSLKLYGVTGNSSADAILEISVNTVTSLIPKKHFKRKHGSVQEIFGQKRMLCIQTLELLEKGMKYCLTTKLFLAEVPFNNIFWLQMGRADYHGD